MSSGKTKSHDEAMQLVNSIWHKILQIKVGEKNYITTAQWEVAGSIRRKKRQVGDAEFVAIPLYVAGRNLLWDRLDQLVLEGTIIRARKSDGKTRWGPTYRAFALPDDPQFHFEIFSATRDNFGVIFGIRTGSATYSQAVMTAIKKKENTA